MANKEHSAENLDAPWIANLKHRKDPNRVEDPHTPHGGAEMHRERLPEIPPDSVALHAARQQPTGDAFAHDAQHARLDEPSYHDVPMLQAPVWKYEIAVYFFLGGVSAASYIVARLADRFGGERYRDVARVGSYVSLAALLPCPPLLIWDLGDPMRFHHMLRVWKPTSPMNFGTWILSSYSGPVTLEAVRQFILSRGDALPEAERSKLMKLAADGKLVAISDAAGVPLALLLATYTGILLSTTANPLWSKNRWLSPLFVASAISTGSEAISLALDATTRGDHSTPQRALQRLDTIAHAAEGVAMRGFLAEAGEKAQPLTTGMQKRNHHLAIGAIVAAEVVKLIPVPASMQKSKRMLASTLGLVGGFAMRWSMSYGGHESGNDPHAARVNSRGLSEPPMKGAYSPTPTTPNRQAEAGGNA